MAELVPDTWRYEEEGSKCCHQSRRTSRRAPVTDILLWLECYASMAALLATRYPNKAAELLAYQRTILCAHRDFEGEAWATYDTCYRRQAAAKKSLDWSQVDFNLYNQTSQDARGGARFILRKATGQQIATIALSPGTQFRSAQSNMQSAKEHPHIIEEYLHKETMPDPGSVSHSIHSRSPHKPVWGYTQEISTWKVASNYRSVLSRWP